MGNKNSNYPSNQLNTLNGDNYTGEVVSSLIELSKWGTPRNEQELEDRMNRYFQYCITNNIRPGIETLCLALSISRQTFGYWLSGKVPKSDEWVRLCIWGRQTVIAFIENASLSGKLNPATAIFCLKNWAGYSDNTPALESGLTEKATQQRFENVSKYRAEVGDDEE